MTRPDSDHRVACATLTYLAEPASPLMGRLLRSLEPGGILASIKSGAVPAGVASALDESQVAALRPALARWRARLGSVPAEVARPTADGVALVCPGDSGWPVQLDDLGAARPYALWGRGSADLRVCCARSVAIVGARAATAYGSHVATEFAASLVAGGWAVMSGGAYGIDAAAHRGAVAADGLSVAVLACGPDLAYPAGHRDLFGAVAARGAVISEWPPGTPPSRRAFLHRTGSSLLWPAAP